MKVPIRRFSRYLLIALIIVGCCYVLWPGYVQYNKHREEIKSLKADISKLEAERTSLEEQMRALQNEDPEQIERVAREKLHLTKPGETLFRFKDKK
jgi:cell division protein FtsB